jgi:hypothetical protein
MTVHATRRRRVSEAATLSRWHPPGRWARVIEQPELGSTTPLILGFFLIALLFVGATTALSDAVGRQRALQATCDGASIAAANQAQDTAVHGTGTATRNGTETATGERSGSAPGSAFGADPASGSNGHAGQQDEAGSGTQQTAPQDLPAIPLADADAAIESYLARDPSRAGVTAIGDLSADGQSITLTCTQHTRLAFAALLGRADGIDQTARSTARSPLLP